MAASGMDLTLEGADELRRKVARFSVKYGVSLRFIGWDQLYLWTADVMANMPPKALKTGRKAMSEDLIVEKKKDTYGLFVPLEKGMFAHVLSEEGPFVHFQNSSGGGGFKISKRKILNHELAVKRIHKKLRSKDGGVRIPQVPSEGWGGRYVVSKPVLISFMKKQYAKIGTLKANFIVPAEHYAKLTKRKANIPAWVQNRASKLKGGRWNGKLDKDGNGFVEAVNEVTYAGQKSLGRKWWKVAEEKRQKDLTSGAFKRMHDLVRRAGLAEERV